MTEKNLPEEQQSPSEQTSLDESNEEIDSPTVSAPSLELPNSDTDVPESNAPLLDENFQVDQIDQTVTPLVPTRPARTQERMPSRRTVLRQERRRRSSTRRRRKRVVYGILGGIVAGTLILGLVVPSFAGLVSPSNASSGNASDGTASVGTAVPIVTSSVLAQDMTYSSYPSAPPTSGPSYATGVEWGIYTEQQPDEAIVRNLEQGAIVLNHSLSDDVQITDLEDYLKAQTGYPGCFILQPHTSVLEGSVILTSWGWMETYTGVDRPGMQEFVADHKNHAPSFLDQTCGTGITLPTSEALDASGN